jgi:hypothetical protein
MKPILCLVAIGSQYTMYISPSVRKILEKKFRICLLTDDKSQNGFFDIEIYTSKVFTYFAKLTFSIEMAIKHQHGVYYCDVDKLDELNSLRGFDKDTFTYTNHWPGVPYFKQLEKENYWRRAVWFWIAKGYNYNFTQPIEEHTFYMPYHKQSNKLLDTIKEIQPIFEEMSTSNDNIYSHKGIGNGEGLALSYALDVCNIQTQRLL